MADPARVPISGFDEVFAKEQAFRLKPALDRGDLGAVIPDDYVHVFLIRDPTRSVTSFWNLVLNCPTAGNQPLFIFSTRRKTRRRGFFQISQPIWNVSHPICFGSGHMLTSENFWTQCSVSMVKPNQSSKLQIFLIISFHFMSASSPFFVVLLTLAKGKQIVVFPLER